MSELHAFSYLFDWTGALLSVVAVSFLFRKSIWYWILSIAANLLLGILYLSQSLYMAAGLQVSFILFATYAIFRWRVESRAQHLPDYWERVGTVLALFIFIYTLLATRFTTAIAYFEFAAVSSFIVANWLTAKKQRFCWLAWIAGNSLFAPVLWEKHLYGMFAVQFIFIAMSLWGWRRWQDTPEGR